MKTLRLISSNYGTKSLTNICLIKGLDNLLNVVVIKAPFFFLTWPSLQVSNTLGGFTCVPRTDKGHTVSSEVCIQI